jgi:hypothetical protein
MISHFGKYFDKKGEGFWASSTVEKKVRKVAKLVRQVGLSI